MGICLWAAMAVLMPFLGTPGLRYPALALLIVLGMVSYFGTGQLIGAFRLSEFKSALKRGG